ncbi:MAG: iron-containing alcohol dehydrogenase [Planctomycetaceae bacterium]
MQDSPLRDSSANPQIPELLTPFDYAPRTRVVFGAGTIGRLGELSAEFGAKRVFLVSDKGLRDAGHEGRGVASLKSAGLDVTIFDETKPNPTTEDVDRALAVAKEADVDLIVGLGGGSSMDCAKGVNFLLTNGGTMEDYRGIGKATKPMLPMIAVPTTAGTGSEAQSFALIANAETHMKMACGDKKAAFRIAILDPELTQSMPPSVTAATGIDALSHALETFVTRPRNTISRFFSRKAWQLLSAGFSGVLHDPDNLERRAAMLLGSHFAGAAIEHSMLGATHALANPLSAHYGVTHGTAIGVLLPHVIRYNARDERVGRMYHQLAADADLCNGSFDPEAPRKLAGLVERLVAEAGSPTSLQTLDVEREMIPTLAEEAAQQWTGKFNPRPVDADSLKELYECAYSGNAS